MDYKKYKKALDFERDYVLATNASTASKFDANANVEHKNVATLSTEVHKETNIGINRLRMFNKIKELYGENLAKEYIRQLESHEIYKNDETHVYFPYCTSITMYPFLLDGLKTIGGPSTAPTNLDSFCGNFINLVFAISSQFAGACLYRDQRILVREHRNVMSYRIKDFVEKFLLRSYPFKDGWEYGDVSNVEVYENNRWVDIKHVFRRKYDDLIYTIKTKNGREFKCSKDHLIRVLDRGELKDIPASDLRVYDTIINTQQGLNVNKESDDYMFGQFIGIIAGDGDIKDRNSIRISVNYQQDFILDFLRVAFPKFTGKNMKIKDGNGCFDAHINSRSAVENIREHFTCGISTYDKGIDVTKYSMDFLCGYLDGLLVTDGLHGGSFRLQTCSENLIDNVIDILNMFCGEKLPKRVVVDHRPNRAKAYSTTVPIKYYKLLDLTTKFNRVSKYAELGSKKQKHTETSYVGGRYAKKSTLHGYERLSNCHSKIDFGTDVIVEITSEKNDDDYVYEIETDSHYYSISGYLCHNCATPEILVYLDHFIRLEFGDNYYLHSDVVYNPVSNRKRTIKQKIEDCFEQIVYSINEPAAARNYQSVFWNVSYFDRGYFDAIFEDFVFPDGDEPKWESVLWLQKCFMKWFNKERTRNYLTFPVETVNLLYDEETKEYKDKDFADFVAEMWSEGASFFCYNSSSADSLSSCCRLRSGITDNVFSYTLGAGGIMTGSKSVITINMNRLVQDAIREEITIAEKVRETTKKVHKYLLAHNAILVEEKENGLLPIYDAGYISLEKQYLTLGVNGVLEGAEFLGIEIGNNEEYSKYCESILSVIYEENRKERQETGWLFNCEYVPKMCGHLAA